MWTETESLTFTARHEEGDAASAERMLDDLEDLRLRLEDRFETIPEATALVVHSSPIWLSVAHPYLPAARLAAAKAGRRYMTGLATRGELHVLSDRHLDRLAAGEDSREALRRTPERLYTQTVVALNNGSLPPPWNPFRFERYMRWAWLAEGAAQYFSGQVPLFRGAVTRRMRESRKPAFPPGPRDATILGGTIFELLETSRGPDKCELLVSRLRKDGPVAALELAFGERSRDIERAWRESLAAGSGRRVEKQVEQNGDDGEHRHQRRREPQRRRTRL